VLDASRQRMRVDFVPRVPGMYALYIEDDSGLRNSRLFELRLRPDPAPTVRLDRPSASRDVLTVLPTAELVLELVADDPQYALRSVFLEYRTGPNDLVRRLPLYDHRIGHAPQIAPWAGTAVLAAPVPRLRPTRLEFHRTLYLKDIRHLDGSALKEGDVVLLQACADDFDDVTPGKEPGRSHQVEIRIIGRAALDLIVNQEQGRVQQELTRLLAKQREAREKVAAVEKKLRKGERPTQEDLEQLLQAEQLQQQIRERVGSEKEGLRSEVARIKETLRQNGMRQSNARERMDKVARQLDRLAEKELQQIEPKLTNSRKLAELLDEKARAERKAQLEQRARQAEKEARTAEEAARREKAHAARAAEQAKTSQDDRARARLEAEAKRARERAREQRERARELKEQAKRDREEARKTPSESAPRQALGEARRGQEEVEKTLGALLKDMEPWSSTREVKAEAARLLQEQKQLRAELEEMARKDPEMVGKKLAELTPEQRAELENHRDAQRRLQERANALLNQMKRVAEQREEKDPETARELREAADKAEAENLVGQMKEAAEKIKQNNSSSAQRSQRKAAEALQKLVKNLEDRREAELDRLIRKLREAERKVAELEEEQDRLKKKMDQAAKEKDPVKREQALKRLARKQKQLKKKTEEVVKQLSRMRSERARQALAQAQAEMGEADKQLSRGKKDDDKQEDVLDRLDEARKELERARKQAEEELAREQLARVGDILKRIRARQAGHQAEAERIQREVQQREGWNRGLKASLRNLGENQKGLAAEAVEVGKKELNGTPVFAKQLQRAARAMELAAKRLSAMVLMPPPAEELPDGAVARQQALALRRLDQLLEALKEAQDQPQRLSKSGGEEGGEEGGKGREPDGPPPLAQLKLLRHMQKEVKDRTEAFHKKHPNLDALNPRQKKELDGIRREQKEIADLLEELLRPAGEDGGEKDEPEKKDEKKDEGD
jgi:hypothetical protein